MKSWRTTLIGTALAVLTSITNYEGDLSDWKVWAPAAAIAALGYFMRDDKVTSESTGAK